MANFKVTHVENGETAIINMEVTPEELNRIRHAVNLGILAMNLKSREVLKVIDLRNQMRDAVNQSKRMLTETVNPETD